VADLASRAEWEARLARANGKLGQQALNEIMDALGDPPSAANITPALWEKMSAAQLEVLIPVLRDIYLEAAKQMIDDYPAIGVDWGLVNNQALEWSRKYGFELVRGITETSKEGLQSAVGSFFEQQWTMGDLRGALEGTFGPVRAEMIAATEVTRASVQGEMDLVDQLKEQGFEMVAIWQTSNDERVCPLCGPLDGTKQGEGWDDPPPLHVRCRCWLTYDFAESE
jgi:hypothetical protein